LTEDREENAEATIDVEWSRETKNPGDLRRRVAGLVAELQEQLISRRKLGEGPLQRRLPLVALQTLLGSGALARGHIGDVHVGCQSQGQSAAERPLGIRFTHRFAAHPPEHLTLALQTQAPGNYDQPRSKSSVSIRGELAKPVEVILLKPLEHISIAIHGRVVPAAKGPAHVEEEGRCLGKEPLPSLLAPRRCLAREQRDQLGRKSACHEVTWAP
jgi:hypothetical protein